MLHPYPLIARSFLVYGKEVDPADIIQGDIVIFPRGSNAWEGHVGFYYGTVQDGRWIILGGNQNNKVQFDLYDPRRALGVRRHSIE
tara:strand:- start:76 stop:333 length:258 start_codon:yes stop_codon:yes gene_type:complete